MRAIHVPMIRTPEDKRRGAAVKSAEEKRGTTVRTPTFVREGRGACRDAGDPDDFTNDDTRGAAGREARARARAVCGDCPFAAQCLPWAKATNRSGIFGGEWLIAGKETSKP